jgi:hypothetical protein
VIDQRLVAGVEQGARRAVGHCERAVVGVERSLGDVVQDVLVNARVRAELGVVPGSDQTMLGAEDLSPLPHLGDLDLIDPIPPGVPDRVHGFVLEIGQRQLKELPAVELAKLPILRLDPLQELCWQGPLQILTQKGVRIVLISKTWRRLLEVHTLLNLAEHDDM